MGFGIWQWKPHKSWPHFRPGSNPWADRSLHQERCPPQTRDSARNFLPARPALGALRTLGYQPPSRQSSPAIPLTPGLTARSPRPPAPPQLFAVLPMEKPPDPRSIRRFVRSPRSANRLSPSHSPAATPATIASRRPPHRIFRSNAVPAHRLAKRGHPTLDPHTIPHSRPHPGH